MSSETQRTTTPAALDRWVSLYLYSSTVRGRSKLCAEPKGSWSFTALPNLRVHYPTTALSSVGAASIRCRQSGRVAVPPFQRSVFGSQRSAVSGR